LNELKFSGLAVAVLISTGSSTAIAYARDRSR
jgi:hypothetical protein